MDHVDRINVFDFGLGAFGEAPVEHEYPVGIRCARRGKNSADWADILPPENLEASIVEIQNIAPGSTAQRVILRGTVQNTKAAPTAGEIPEAIRCMEIQGRLTATEQNVEAGIIEFSVAKGTAAGAVTKSAAITEKSINTLFGTAATQFLGYKESAAAPTTTEFPATNDWGFHKDTVGNAWRLCFNAAGVIKSVVLA